MISTMLMSAESIFLSYLLLCASVLGESSSKVVTLGSIEIFTDYNFLPFKPTIYFRCQGEKVTVLPDVKQRNVSYTFHGEESWQPLTELPEEKCKRCGLYERAFFKSDDVFDEWELCPEDFVDGTYVHFKEYQFNATFRCPLNKSSGSGSDQMSNLKNTHKHKGAAIAITITLAIFVILASCLIIGFIYWQKRKREQEQVRFLKMFEEGDDIEDELGLGPL